MIHIILHRLNGSLYRPKANSLPGCGYAQQNQVTTGANCLRTPLHSSSGGCALSRVLGREFRPRIRVELAVPPPSFASETSQYPLLFMISGDS